MNYKKRWVIWILIFKKGIENYNLIKETIPNKNESEILNKIIWNDSLYNYQEHGRILSKALTQSEDLVKMITENNSKANFLGLKILEIYNDFYSYVDTLSIYHKCLMFNMCTIIFIMGCLLTIIFTFYGDLFINKLGLEQRFPKLAKFIRIRRLFVQFYLLSNTMYIILALILMMYVNYVTFFF